MFVYSNKKYKNSKNLYFVTTEILYYVNFVSQRYLRNVTRFRSCKINANQYLIIPTSGLQNKCDYDFIIAYHKVLKCKKE